MEIGKPSCLSLLAGKETSFSKPFPENRLASEGSDVVSIDVSTVQSGRNAPTIVQLREGDEGAPLMEPAMRELSFLLSEEHVTLRRISPVDIPEIAISGENQKWEGRSIVNDCDAQRPSSLSRVLSSSCHSGSFRESIKTVGCLVKQFSLDLARNSRNVSRVQDLGSPPSYRGVPDPELGDCTSIRKQGSTSSRAEYAIKGLRYISKATATADQKKSWEQVEARFLKLADSENMLHRTNFAECIGMSDSKEFASELFDALVRRKGIEVESITKDELYEYWLQVADRSFDARMQIFLGL